MLRHWHRHAPLLRHYLRRLSTTATTTDDLSTITTLSSPPSSLSPIPSPSSLLATHTVTPPIRPWPSPLTHRRLALLLRRQPTPSTALQAFHHAAHFVPGFRHNYLTFHTLLTLLAHARAFPDVEATLSFLARQDPPVRCGEEAFITIIRAYGLAGKPTSALKTFLSIRPRFRVETSVRAFNSLLNAMIQNHRFDLVATLFKHCKGKFGIRPNVFTCNILIKSLCKLGDLDAALKVLEEMPEWGMVPNLVSYSTVMAAYCSRRDMDNAVKLFEDALERGYIPDALMYSVLVDGYCRLGRLVDAARVMDNMEENKIVPNEVTYSIMIESCCNSKKPGEALNFMEEMLDAEFMPISSLCCKVIDVLCMNGKTVDACRLWRKMLEKNCMPDNSILSALVYWLCKEGKISDAKALFWEFERAFTPSLMTYNTLISGMCENGEMLEAGRFWDHMLEKKCFPNALTYNALIKGFCNTGMINEGIKAFGEMLRKGFILNKLTCQVLIDGLYRLGEQDRVMEVLSVATSVKDRFFNEECWGSFVRKNCGKCGRGSD